MNELLKKALSLGVGVAVVSKEKIENLVDELVKKGEVAPGESKELINRLVEKGEAEQEQWKQLVREQVMKVLTELRVATQEDVEALRERIEKLENPSV